MTNKSCDDFVDKDTFLDFQTWVSFVLGLLFFHNAKYDTSGTYTFAYLAIAIIFVMPWCIKFITDILSLVLKLFRKLKK